MKKTAYLLITVLLTGFPVFAQDKQIDIEHYSLIINTILHNLDIIMAGSGYNKHVAETYSVASELIKNGTIALRIDPESATVLGGMSFDFSADTGEAKLVFGLRYLDTFKNDSSIHYAILMHELRHLYDYTVQRDAFVSAKQANDEKEIYWYELDAIRIEAEFIKEYLSGEYTLSKFEQYLVNSLSNDNLGSISIFLQRESMEIFFSFNRWEEEYRKNNAEKDRLVRTIIDTGSRLLERYGAVDPSNEIAYYDAFIRLSTFRKYMFRFLRVSNTDPKATWESVFSQYPGIESLSEAILEIQNRDAEIHFQYLMSVIDYWEADIQNR
ncbi:hypothetical protein [Breznakiella homolactica]|uniref:Peptidase MA-like domain-containing protein n=1 Tax=Breznakiella homolactica TaxID=2798577 RepID=A0A7T7XP80_9SPIR|nr:hypothetical protein [Breznakiella homolactica]QQO09956.1 hypothetical protein JFL75_03315 [Breznakiella homolactica]